MNEAIIVAAAQQTTAKSEFVMAVLWAVVRGEDVLHLVERGGIDKQWMRSIVRGIAPLIETDAEGVLQNF